MHHKFRISDWSFAHLHINLWALNGSRYCTNPGADPALFVGLHTHTHTHTYTRSLSDRPESITLGGGRHNFHEPTNNFPWAAYVQYQRRCHCHFRGQTPPPPFKAFIWCRVGPDAAKRLCCFVLICWSFWNKILGLETAHGSANTMGNKAQKRQHRWRQDCRVTIFTRALRSD